MPTPKDFADTAMNEKVTLNSSNFESHLEIKSLSQDTFISVHRPWVFGHAEHVPGAFAMAQCALATYQTVPDDFVLHYLQTNFLAPANRSKHFTYKVQRLNTGKKTAVRFVTAEQQGGKLILSATLSFAKTSLSDLGPFLKYSMPVSAAMGDGKIRIDDMVLIRTAEGPFISSERLPIVTTPHSRLYCAQLIPNPKGPSSTPYTRTARAFFRIEPLLSSQRSQILAIVHISDFYLLDGPLALNGLSYGTPAIGDADQKPTRSDTKFLTTLNYTIHFHRHDGFRIHGSDGGVYSEITSPWAKDGRVLAESRIFGRDGVVIATCVQEGYITLQGDGGKNGSKLWKS